MDSEQRQSVCQALCEVIGTFGFLMLEPADHPILKKAVVSGWHGCMQFRGTRSGKAKIWVDSSVAKELAGNLLGEDLGVSNEQASKDAVQELLNVIGGHALSLIHGPDQDIDLLPPSVSPSESISVNEILTVETDYLAFQDEQEALILLTITESASA